MIDRRNLMLWTAFAAIAPSGAYAAAKAHDFSVKAIEGHQIDLADYAGKAVLIVNTASRCGFTRQYDGLQRVWERYRDRGLVVLAAPSNDFRQELADAQAVKSFCEASFGLDFPMTDILHVRGPQADPLFAWLGEQAGAPAWNFHKYLIGADGAVIAAYPSATEPDSARLIAAIEAALPQ